MFNIIHVNDKNTTLFVTRISDISVHYIYSCIGNMAVASNMTDPIDGGHFPFKVGHVGPRYSLSQWIMPA